MKIYFSEVLYYLVSKVIFSLVNYQLSTHPSSHPLSLETRNEAFRGEISFGKILMISLNFKNTNQYKRIIFRGSCQQINY
jgi:hypothetical protein